MFRADELVLVRQLDRNDADNSIPNRHYCTYFQKDLLVIILSERLKKQKRAQSEQQQNLDVANTITTEKKTPIFEMNQVKRGAPVNPADQLCASFRSMHSSACFFYVSPRLLPCAVPDLAQFCWPTSFVAFLFCLGGMELFSQQYCCRRFAMPHQCFVPSFLCSME